jgi:hypothetical protein
LDDHDNCESNSPRNSRLKKYDLRPRPLPKRTCYTDVVDHVCGSRKIQIWPKNTFYEIDVQDLDCDTGRLWIHYVGYSPKWDRWIDRSETKHVPRRNEDSVLLNELVEQIQLKLTIGRGQECKSSIRIPCSVAQFNRLFKSKKELVPIRPAQPNTPRPT